MFSISHFPFIGEKVFTCLITQVHVTHTCTHVTHYKVNIIYNRCISSNALLDYFPFLEITNRNKLYDKHLIFYIENLQLYSYIALFNSVLQWHINIPQSRQIGLLPCTCIFVPLYLCSNFSVVKYTHYQMTLYETSSF